MRPPSTVAELPWWPMAVLFSVGAGLAAAGWYVGARRRGRFWPLGWMVFGAGCLVLAAAVFMTAARLLMPNYPAD